MKLKTLFLSGIVFGVLGWSCVYENEEELYTTNVASETISFENDIKPILETHCYNCHSNTTNSTDGFKNRFGEGITLEGEENVKKIVAFENQKGYLIENIKKSGGFIGMPFGPKISEAKIELIQKWIDQEFSGSLPTDTVIVYDTITTVVFDTVIVNTLDSVSFKKAIVPILEVNCYNCHNGGTGGFGDKFGTSNSLVGYDNVKKIIEFVDVDDDNKKGYLIENIKKSDGFVGMPFGPKLADTTIAKVQTWIDQGITNN